MNALNDWPAPQMAVWPPPTVMGPVGPARVTRFQLWYGIFARTLLLSVLGGMGLGGLCVLGYGPVGLIAVLLGGFVGFPLGLAAGVVLSTVGVLVLRPYRGPAIPILTISLLASSLVAAYLGFGLHAMSEMGASEGPQSTHGPSWDWLLITAWIAAATLSPWVVWWYVKMMEQVPRVSSPAASS